ncbi:hypothetical protein V1291_003606 [Nitrobacteraceae bacterium AZCC 1564]
MTEKMRGGDAINSYANAFIRIFSGCWLALILGVIVHLWLSGLCLSRVRGGLLIFRPAQDRKYKFRKHRVVNRYRPKTPRAARHDMYRDATWAQNPLHFEVQPWLVRNVLHRVGRVDHVK